MPTSGNPGRATPMQRLQGEYGLHAGYYLLSRLQPWGVTAIILNESKLKGATKTRTGWYTGVNPESQSPKILMDDTNRIVESVDVQFLTRNEFNIMDNQQIKDPFDCDDDIDLPEQDTVTNQTASMQELYHEQLDSMNNYGISHTILPPSDLSLAFTDDDVDELPNELRVPILLQNLPTDNYQAPTVKGHTCSGKCIHSQSLHKMKAKAEIVHGMRTPRTLSEALASPQAKEWQQAYTAELQSFKYHNVLHPINSVPGKHKCIPLKPVFKIKTDRNGKVDKFKIRLVSAGYRQVEGLHYGATYSPVLSITTLRTLIALTAEHNYTTRHIDICTAFLHSPLEHEIYVDMPEQYESKHQYAQLNKAVYGLKQGSLQFYKTLTKWFTDKGFEVSTTDPALMIGMYKGTKMRIGIYVDDIAVFSDTNPETDDTIQHMIRELATTFSIKDIGQLDYLIGMGITKKENGNYTIDQNQAVVDLLERHHFEIAKQQNNWHNTPSPPGINLYGTNATDDDHASSKHVPYPSIIGSIAWLTNSRPDLSYVFGQLSRHMHKWGIKHVQYLTHCIKYIQKHQKSTLEYQHQCSNPCNQFPRSGQLVAYCDASHVDAMDEGKSTIGTVIFLNGAPITWSSKLSPVVCSSTAHSEYIAIAEVAKQVTLIQRQIHEITGVKQSTTTIYSDNEPAIRMICSDVPTPLFKHIAAKYHYARQQQQQGVIKVQYVNTKNQLADMFTKSLTKHQFMTNFQQLSNTVARMIPFINQ
jgi:hypothetical protein